VLLGGFGFGEAGSRVSVPAGWISGDDRSQWQLGELSRGGGVEIEVVLLVVGRWAVGRAPGFLGLRHVALLQLIASWRPWPGLVLIYIGAVSAQRPRSGSNATSISISNRQPPEGAGVYGCVLAAVHRTHSSNLTASRRTTCVMTRRRPGSQREHEEHPVHLPSQCHGVLDAPPPPPSPGPGPVRPVP
jgi:hypothetical protein